MLDSNIPLRGQTPSYSLQPLMQALQFKQNRRAADLNQQVVQGQLEAEKADKANQEKIKSIIQANVKYTPEGKKKIDKEGFVQGLYQAGMGQEAMTFAQKFQKEEQDKRTAFLAEQGAMLKARGDIFKQNEPFLRALTDPKARAKLLKDQYKQWQMDDSNLPDSIDDSFLESLAQSAQQQFAPVSYQFRPDAEGNMLGLNPRTNKAEYTRGPNGEIMQVPENVVYKEDEFGNVVPFSTKRPPLTAPKPVPGFKSAGSKKLALETKKTALALEKAGIDLKTAQLLASGGGQFKPTQYEAAIYGLRMRDAEKVLEGLSDEGFDPSTLKNMIMADSKVFEGFKDSAMKRYAQAKKSFINATLRRESGAAIAESEFEDANAQYFAQLNEDPLTANQKLENRQVIQAGMQAEAGGAWDETDKILRAKRDKSRGKLKAPKGSGSTPAKPVDWTPEKQKRLEELRRKRDAGTLK